VLGRGLGLGLGLLLRDRFSVRVRVDQILSRILVNSHNEWSVLLAVQHKPQLCLVLSSLHLSTGVPETCCPRLFGHALPLWNCGTCLAMTRSLLLIVGPNQFHVSDRDQIIGQTMIADAVQLIQGHWDRAMSISHHISQREMFSIHVKL